MKNPIHIELSSKFIELTLVDADEVESDAVNIDERKFFLQKQISYQPIELKEVFSKKLPLLLISGIAGIGKTWLLKKCLLDWAYGSIWKDIDIVFYLECRQLNQFQSVGNIDELLKLLYKDVFKGCNICPNLSILFLVDGLDEFVYLNELLNHSPQSPSKYPIVNALAQALDVQKYKCVVAGRVGAITSYKNKVKELKEKLYIQVMGFNKEGINDYLDKNAIKDHKIKVEKVLQSSYIAKAMASVPFYLAAMCAIITAPSYTGSYSFNSMTELYCGIFLYFFLSHINKNNEPMYMMMRTERNKQYILRVCKVAWHLLNEGKIIFSYSEMQQLLNDFEKHNDELLGFVEKIESHFGYQYQFVHLSLMEFCASVHAYLCLSHDEIIGNKRMRSCVPIICGLMNKDKRSFVSFLANWKDSNEEKSLFLDMVYSKFTYLN